MGPFKLGSLQDIYLNRFLRFKNYSNLIKDNISDFHIERYDIKYNLGESFYISDLYIALNAVPGVIDTTNVEVSTKTGAGYSQFPFSVGEHLSNDGRVLHAPDKIAFEVKDFDADITGVIK